MEDADVVEISGISYADVVEISRSTKKRNSKQAEIIDIDDEHDDVIILDEEASTRSHDVINLDTRGHASSLQSRRSNATLEGSARCADGSPREAGNGDILTRLKLFKRFDIVQDYSDHFFKLGSWNEKHLGFSRKRRKTFVAPVNQTRKKKWAQRIQQEWRMLENDLSEIDMIYARGYESRMDLMRAVMVGADGTPYHDGLYFFDIFFPDDYPDVPPEVRYHSYGIRINKHFNGSGYICLSIMKNVKVGGHWQPGVSNVKQILLSIQALVLNKRRYLNGPLYERRLGIPEYEIMPHEHSEWMFFASLLQMVNTMKMPPKHFEEFVNDHFCNRADDILVACKAYMGGAEVGCLTKGGIQDVDEGYKSFSLTFRRDLPQYVGMVVTKLSKIPGISETVRNFFLHISY